MRTISAQGAQHAEATAQSVAWLLDLVDGDWHWHGATRPAAFNAVDYPARIVEVERWSESLPAPDGILAGGCIRAEARILLADDPNAADSLRARLEFRRPTGWEATLRLGWFDPAAPADPAVEPTVLLRGRVSRWQIEPAGVRLILVDPIQALAHRRPGRLLDASLQTAGPVADFGSTIPWVFGSLARTELLTLHSGAASQLRLAVDSTVDSLRLVSTEGFPAQGVVQLGDELVEYPIVNPHLSLLGIPGSLGVTRGANAHAHPAGATVRVVPEGGFRWLVADHPCAAVHEVYADGLAVPAEQWQAEIIDLDGRTVQTVRMSTWPMNADGRQARRLTARVDGLLDETDALIENPADVIARLLTDAHLGGLPADRLDADSFAALRAELEAVPCRFARRLGGRERLGELIDSAAFEAGLWVAGDPIALRRLHALPHPAETVAALDPASALLSDAPATLASPDPAPPDAVELVRTTPAAASFTAAYRYPAAVAGGVQPRRLAVRWLDLDRGAAAAQAAERLWSHWREPLLTHVQHYPLGKALLQAGETIEWTDPALGAVKAPLWLTRIETGIEIGPGRVRLALNGPWAGALCWQHDPFTHLRLLAFGSQLAVVIEGRVVALLDAQGNLRLAGRLREHADLAAGPFPGPIAFHEDRLYCNIGVNGVYAPFLALDASGNLELNGGLRETSTHIFHTGAGCHGADAAGFWLSPDPAHAVLEFEAATSILHLKGALIESLNL